VSAFFVFSNRRFEKELHHVKRNWLDRAGIGCGIVVRKVVDGPDEGVALDAVPGIFRPLIDGSLQRRCPRNFQERKGMSASKHNVESEGAKPHDQVHPRHHFWRQAHRDWRVWVAAMLMVALILVFVMTNNLSLGWGKRPIQQTPTANPR
jgi:hypothetical protein